MTTSPRRQRHSGGLLPRFIRSSYRRKLFLALLLLGGTASLVTSILIGYLLHDVEINATRESMLATVVQMAEAIDPEAVRALGAADDVGSHPAFAPSRELLMRMRTAIIEAHHADREDAEGWFVDLYVLTPTDRPGWGRLAVTYVEEEAGRDYDMTRFPDMMRGWEEPVVEDVPATDEYGTTLSAYAPVRDADGAVVGIVGIDIAATYFYIVVFVTVVITLLLLAGTAAVSLLVAWFISWRMSRPLGRLSSGMRQVARGDLQTQLAPTGSGDEFDTLMRQFNTMVGGLRDREAIRRDLGEAAAIQHGLLPTAPPHIPGFDIAGGILYCQHTGGDYYDYLRFDGIDGGPGTWGIVVGDVTGHGTGSSLLMASARAVLRSAAHRAGADVSSLMAYVNDHLLRDSPVGAFMTMFYGVLEPGAGRLGWTSAGHEPGVLWRSATDEVTHLRSTDIPLGIDADRPFAAGEPIVLAVGDILVIGTDGATQARDATGQFFGVDRLADVVRSNAASAAEEIRDAIFTATRAHEATEGPADDVTLVVVKRVGH